MQDFTLILYLVIAALITILNSSALTDQFTWNYSKNFDQNRDLSDLPLKSETF